MAPRMRLLSWRFRIFLKRTTAKCIGFLRVCVGLLAHISFKTNPSCPILSLPPKPPPHRLLLRATASSSSRDRVASIYTYVKCDADSHILDGRTHTSRTAYTADCGPCVGRCVCVTATPTTNGYLIITD